MSFLSTLAQTSSDLNYNFDSSYYSTTAADSGASTGVALVFTLVYFLFLFVFVAVVVASMWKIFTKAGKEGWAAIIPIYNTIVTLEIVGRPTWWLVWYLVPVANVVVSIIVALDLAKVFGKSAGYGLLLAFVPLVGYPMLAFSDSTYQGPLANTGSPATPTNTPPQVPPTQPAV